MKIEYEMLSISAAETRGAEDEERTGILRPAIQVRLIDMTAERKCYLFEELACEDEGRLNELVLQVEQILHTFLYHKNIRTRNSGLDSFTSGAAKKTFATIHQHLNKAHELMETLEDRSLDFLTPDDVAEFNDVSFDDFDIEAFQLALRLVAERAGQISNEIAPARGRPARDDLFDALIDLACVYERETGRKAGYSSRPEKKPGATGHEVHGPFVRFVHRVFDIVDHKGVRVEPSPPSTIDNAIRRYVDTRNSRTR
ncbi:hypothetical protein [uncultured Thioclava sp.]|uniref:hypothetical protein n=1 Tax=uncultured Thioclava sp. TaxID=473858 RepID=UPI0025F2462C|nr:hypothetical protein [uncultured Thioclava sp.]